MKVIPNRPTFPLSVFSVSFSRQYPTASVWICLLAAFSLLSGCNRIQNEGAATPQYGVLAFSFYMMSGDLDLAMRFVGPAEIERAGGVPAMREILSALHEHWKDEEYMSVKVLSVRKTRAGANVRVSVQQQRKRLLEQHWFLARVDEAYYIDPTRLF